MTVELGRFQLGKIVTGRIISLESMGVLVDFDTSQPVHVPLSELSLNEIQTPEDALNLNEVREFLVVGNYDGEHDIAFGNCSPETLMDRDLLETAYYLASREWEHPVNRENIVLHTKILCVYKNIVSVRLQWFVCSEEHSPSISFSIRQLEAKKAWERVRQLQSENATVYATVLRKYQRSATVKVEGLLGSIRTYVDKHGEELVEGKELPLKIMEVEEEFNRLVLLHHSVWFRIRQLQVGQLVSGTVRGVRDYGVLVDIGDLNALLLTSRMSNSFGENSKQMFAVNAPIESRIAELDVEGGRVILDGLVNSV